MRSLIPLFINRSTLLRLLCILFMPLVAGILSTADANADWLEQMSRDAKKNLERQNSRAGGGGGYRIERWYAMCNKPGRYVVLGKQIPANHSVMSDPYGSEPVARNWTNANCSSWKCDWNGRCVTASRSTSPGGIDTPYDDGGVGSGVFGQ